MLAILLVCLISASAQDSNALQDLGGEGCTKSKPCGKCEGDCDRDSDCAGNLVCFQRDSSSELVPGCERGGSGDIDTHDYCYEPDYVLSQVAAPGECLSNQLNDLGMVLGNAPHTIQVRLTFPQSISNRRQWILNLGQNSPGAHHWTWRPSNNAIQFGAWSGHQINGVDITQCTDLSTTFSGSVLKLYCNGVFMRERAVAFSITDSNIAIGNIGSQFVHEDPFAGCISEVKVWSHEKSADQIAQQSLPAFWESCRWVTVQDPNLASNDDTKDFFGFSCADKEILTGFGLSANENDVTRIQCCELGGHSSVISGTCSFIDAGNTDSQTQGFQPDVAICDANAHMVFSGAYDKKVKPGDEITELLAGKCCEVECDAQWCAGQDWGVNSDKCETISVDPHDNGKKNLVCPHGTLMTEIRDGFAGGAHGLQNIASIVCCELDLVAEPTKAPTCAPSPAPTSAPSPLPTPAPTSTTECLLELHQATLTTGQFLQGIDRCLPWCEVEQNQRAH